MYEPTKSKKAVIMFYKRYKSRYVGICQHYFNLFCMLWAKYCNSHGTWWRICAL